VTLEVTPAGVACNLSCSYCYQSEVRRTEEPRAFDLSAVKRALEREASDFVVFGGEPLLAPLADLEALWAFGFERHGRNGVQTNAALITDRHVELFKRYAVHVGVSIDGPGELNDARWAGTEAATRTQTARSCWNLARLLRDGVSASLIVTLHRLNASPDRLPRLVKWIRSLEREGLRSARLHVLEVDGHGGADLRLSDEDAIAALLAFERLEAEVAVRFDVFTDVRNLLRGTDGSVTCIWNGCDPHTTPAVRNVNAQGELTNCVRASKDGIDWPKADQGGQDRQLVLYSTPYEDGGCQGCRFFVACKGQCPGTALEGDFRNRSRDCRIWFGLLEHVEGELVAGGEVPVSLRPELPQIEAAMLDGWKRGRIMTVADGLEGAAAAAGNASRPVPAGSHGDAPHGDAHGDEHGDHTDFGR